MLPDGRRLGAHLAVGEGMARAAERAVEIGIDALQVFSDNPTAWQRRAAPNPEIARFRSVLDAHDIAPLAIHGSYLINLAGSDETLWARSIGLLAAELASARRYGAQFVNIHTGSYRGADVAAGIARLVDGVRRAFDDAGRLVEADGLGEVAPGGGARSNPGARSGDPVVVLENGSGGGSTLGIDLQEWAAIATAFDHASVDRGQVGFCLDTAHLWGAGHDVADPAAMDALFAGFDGAVGLDRLRMLHLNDSKVERGSRMDRHEHIAAGRIGPAGFRHLLTHERLRHVASILETPGMDEGYDAVNVRRALALARGEPLEPLPPEAFQIRGSRSRAATPKWDDSVAAPPGRGEPVPAAGARRS